MTLLDKIKNWYRGKYIPPPENDPNSGVVFLLLGHYEQPPLAKALKWIGNFWLSHWQWIIGTTLAVIGIFIAL
jgi:hypothetical protein